MNKKLFLYVFVLASIILVSSNARVIAQNIAINATGTAAVASAMLDITSSTSGLLIPRMTAAQRAAIGTPATSLLVYQTDAGTMGIGYYFYNGTAWVPFGTNNGGWGLAGNAGTVAATNYLGTTDAIDFVIRTTATERIRVLAAGNIGIGTTTPAYMLTTVGSSATYIGRFENTSNASIGALNGRNTAASGAGTGSGVVGVTAQTGGFALYGVHTNAAGTGIVAIGQNSATYTTLVAGSGVAFTATGTGGLAFANTATGVGFFAAGQNVAGFGSPVGGCGLAGNGTSMGVYGTASAAGNNNWGGYFQNGNANGYAFVGGRVGGIDYKINGPGAVATIVEDLNGNTVNLVCPESPEILFQDFGNGKLINGKTHITLDPILTKNICVNEKHPLRVFIQLGGDCKGVYVTNESSEGFDVVELQGGDSNVNFSWFISANRADTVDKDGNVLSKNSDARFPDSAKKPEIKIWESKTTEGIK